MPEVTIRRLSGAELDETIYTLGAYAFEPSPPLAKRDDWARWTASQDGLAYYALFEDGVAASGAAASVMTQNVRGARYAAHGVWAVATSPAYRRRGYTRRVMAEMMRALSAEGDVFSTLYPFKESFYERLGYVAFPLPRTARFSPSGLAPLLGFDLGGHVELKMLAEGHDAYRDYLLRLSERVHGMAVFVHPNPAVPALDPAWLALARIDGEVAGVMVYVLRGQPDSPLTLRAKRFYYDSSQARYLLLQWIARHMDQAERAEITLPPAELPETWLADLQLRADTDHRPPMGRVLNVGRLSGMQVGPGQFTARVGDPLCPWNEGAWRFAAEDGRLAVAPGEDASFGLTIQGLAALVYGTNDPGDFAVRGWGDPPPPVQDTLRAMFPPAVPHLHERF